ncbi:isochorismate synthase [Flavobacterium franklandianum]|uniref:isochorismate synthase n=1 Tax=Flavobacterium franklandianum TaxID=2594430 RepID=A0A553C8D4_9FLAO|nr:isochorismate synthase [Flavobacterium franklandianum]TRX16672.1 isochorismate synthase [Flavobacterium franklandianum]
MKQFLDKAKNHLAQNLPFVLYKKPKETNITGLFQKNDTLFAVTDFTEKGFVFASFDGTKIVLIPEKESEIRNTVFQKTEIVIQEKTLNLSDETAQNQFENLVKKGIQAIENNEFKKVVLSRKESLNLTDFDLITAFQNLVQLYPTTFVYCFYHPKIGTWLGATPEQLLKANDAEFKTIALAGTQKATGSNEVVWPKKEQEEQQFVTDYIVEKLKNVASELVVSIPYSLKAGSIWHIKTDISGRLNSSSSLQQVIQLLHPTPAVCGFPKDKSKAFILENEKYDRTFYTGFLGELNMGDKTDLFVNLRCMEIEVASKIALAQAHLFMGCGITKDSIPEKEWEESKNKSVTMKKILDCRF